MGISTFGLSGILLCDVYKIIDDVIIKKVLIHAIELGDILFVPATHKHRQVIKRSELFRLTNDKIFTMAALTPFIMGRQTRTFTASNLQRSKYFWLGDE